MKIAIIGGGWVGCHLANKFRHEHSVTLFEKNNELFKETSFKNQNRLHLGYHYARNGKTRNMCKNTFERFMFDYGFMSNEIPKNYYCVVKNKSIVDFETYKLIFGIDNDNTILPEGFNQLENCINVEEKYIDFQKASEYFNSTLKEITINEHVDSDKLKELSKKFDLVINATNNQITEIKENTYFEVSLSLVYQKISNTNFDAVTMVDGQFFSIYPYKENYFTLTDVEFTPLKIFDKIENVSNYVNNVDNFNLSEKINLIETKVKYYFPNFSNYFKYKDYFVSLKSKMKSLSDDRYPVIKEKDNIVSCFTGKIQGIYIIEDYIRKTIKDKHENNNR
jgi:putative NADH-flavin reductase